MSAARSRVLAAAAIAGALTLGYLAQGTFASGMPANKVGASGATNVIVGANQEVTVLERHIKINNPTDLIISVSSECGIFTSVSNSAGDPQQNAFGRITMRVEIDGKVVPVATDDPTNGSVTFCSRTQSQKWTDGPAGEDNKDVLTQSTDTLDANAFNWMALNVGTNYPGTTDNIHDIKLIATWKTVLTDTTKDQAHAVVGKRTIVLDPVKAAHGDTVETIN